MTSSAGEFTVLARGLNIVGGFGFLVAGVFFVRRFHRHAEETDWLFAVHTLLFGVAGVLFELSILWDAAWWWWHILRLIAYVAAFVFAVAAYLNAEQAVLSLNQELTKLNQELDQTVEARTSELSASEQRYALAVRGSTDGLWDWNVLTGEVYYSPRFKELLGYNDNEFPHVFESFESHLHEEDLDGVKAAVQSHLQEHVPYDIEYRLRNKSDEYRWFRARWSSHLGRRRQRHPHGWFDYRYNRTEVGAGKVSACHRGGTQCDDCCQPQGEDSARQRRH